jgi:hypothetical protein
MAFIKTSDSIIIKATLTDEGRKLLSRGNFKISKFAFGDDEIDYELFDPHGMSTSDGYLPALLSTKLLEAYGDKRKNIQFGLNSYDSGINYLTSEEITILSPANLHAFIMYLPILKQNNKLDVSPTNSGSYCYLSVNDETTEKLENISNFRFLTSNKLENTKIIIESGISNFGPGEYTGDLTYPSKRSREEFILKKFLLDSDYFVFTDDRFINKVYGIRSDSRFENFASGETMINFKTDDPTPAISYESEFNNYATRVLPGIPNLMFDHPPGVSVSTPYNVHDGPRGSVVALNPTVNQEMKVNSTSTTDFRFTKFGKTDQFLFAELPLDKFDYINTTIYIIGATTNSRVTIPIRIIRYAGR